MSKYNDVCLLAVHSSMRRSELLELRWRDIDIEGQRVYCVRGAHPKIVQKQLGHSSISVTMDSYSHVQRTLQVEATANSAEMLDNRPSGSKLIFQGGGDGTLASA